MMSTSMPLRTGLLPAGNIHKTVAVVAQGRLSHVLGVPGKIHVLALKARQHDAPLGARNRPKSLRATAFAAPAQSVLHR